MTQTAVLKSERTISIIKVVAGALAMAASAQVAIPLNPVPITFHTVVVMIIGLTYRSDLARYAMSTYILAGAMGVPVFTNFSSGIPYMMGPTGGYLLGFWLAACAMPYFRQVYGSSWLANTTNCIIGHLLIYFFGVAWLSTIIGFDMAFTKGFLIYIPTGIAKIAILVTIMRYIKR